MGNYIEKDVKGEFFNPVSNTVKVNPDCDCNCNGKGSSSITNENYERWRWLHIHLITKKEDFDDALNREIARLQFEYCRTLKGIKFDPDGQGIPNLIMVFGPIIIEQIPDYDTKAKVISWANSMNLIDCKKMYVLN